MLYDDFSDGLLSDNSADEDWWGSDDEWKASAITDREDRPIDHGKLGTSESTSTPPGDEMSAEYVPAWAVSERKDAKEKVCTVSTPGKEMPMIQWFSASTMPVSVGTNDDDDEAVVSSDESWWDSEDEYLNSPELNQPSESACKNSLGDSSRAVESAQSIANVVPQATQSETPSEMVQMISDDGAKQASNEAKSGSTRHASQGAEQGTKCPAQDDAAANADSCDAQGIDGGLGYEASFDEAVQRALGMLEGSNTTPAPRWLEDDSPFDREQGTPDVYTAPVERGSLPRRNRKKVDGETDDSEEELSSDENWWESEDEYLEEPSMSPSQPGDSMPPTTKGMVDTQAPREREAQEAHEGSDTEGSVGTDSEEGTPGKGNQEESPMYAKYV